MFVICDFDFGDLGVFICLFIRDICGIKIMGSSCLCFDYEF